MKTPSTIIRIRASWAFSAILASATALGALEDPPIAPETARREALRKREVEVQDLRAEVEKQLADPVALQRDRLTAAEKALGESQETGNRARNAARDYQAGIFPRDLAAAESKVSLARADLERAEDRPRGARDKEKAGPFLPRSTILRAQLGLEQARFDLEQAQTRLKVLSDYTMRKRTRQLRAAVEDAEATEAERTAAVESERSKLAKLIEQADRLKAHSPEDLVLALIDGALKAEDAVVALIRESQAIEAEIRARPAEAADLAEKLREKRAQAGPLMNRARSQLLDAGKLAEQVRAARAGLLAAEDRLRRERANSDRLGGRAPRP